MKKDSVDFTRGFSSNGIPYARWGSADKILFIINGGPGNMLPAGTGMPTMSYDPFLDEYTIVMVSRKTGIPENYSTEDMADDCARMIIDDLGGKVHGAMGISFGGMILQHFTAKYPELAERHVIAVAANKMSDEGKAFDKRFAVLQSEGKPRRAASLLADIIAPTGFLNLLYRGLLLLLGGSFIDRSSETFETDILREAEAEINHNGEESIKIISIPVLMICGGSDLYFSAESARETAAMNSNINLKIYEGKGHTGTIGDKRFTADILDFLK